MPDRAAVFQERHDVLRHTGAELSAALRAAAALLTDGRLDLPTDLANRIREYRTSAESLLADLVAAAPAGKPSAAAAGRASLATLAQTLLRVEQHERERVRFEAIRTRAQDLLSRLLRITCSDEAGQLALDACRSGARELQTYFQEVDVTALPPDATELAEGRHPWCALVTLVESGETLDDEKWGQLHDVVTTIFGRALAAAVARNRLQLPPAATAALQKAPPPGPTEPAAGVDSRPLSDPRLKATAAPVAIPQPVRPETEPQPEPQPKPKPPQKEAAPGPAPRAESLPTPPSRAVDSRKSVDPTKKASPPNLNEAPSVAPVADRSVDLDADAESSGAPQHGNAVIVRSNEGTKTPASPRSVAGTRRILPTRASQNTVPAIAQAASATVGRTRYEHIARLLWKLVLEGRLGIAYHLSRCLEQRTDNDVPLLPSSLLKALALAPHVRFPLGETSRQLAADFARLRTARAPKNDSEWTIAWQLLLSAASLRPALLAPTSNASAVLHSLRMIEGLSRLYNYSHRIAIFGDQPQSLDVNTFKRGKSEQAWQYELELVVSEAEGWCAQTPVRRIRYQSATHCFLRSHWSVMRSASSADPQVRDQWRIWQSTVDRLHAMLEPVRRNVEARTAFVRGEADLLSNPAEIDRLTSGSSLGRYVAATDPSSREQLRIVVAEAVGLARRWLRLHDATPERRPISVPRRAEEVLDERRALQLRDEILSRQDAVLKELKSVAERYNSPVIVTSVACCCRAIESIRQLFDPDETVASDEVDPRAVLHSELLLIPNLTLNDLWEPEVTAQELENDLLQLLTRGQAEWRDAFIARAEEGDHEATARLLSLDVWQNPEERGELTETREKRLKECRDNLWRDIESTRTRVLEARKLGLIQDHDQDHFDAEIATVEAGADATLRFPATHRRLSEIREGLERRRHYEIQRVRQRFDELHLQAEHPATARIDAALNDGNVKTASQYIDLVTNGQDPEGEASVR